MKTYQVIVGNVGTVHTGNNPVLARKDFGEYKRQSREGDGRAAYETVTLLCDGEIEAEFRPKLQTPTIEELACLIRAIKSDICDDYKEEEDDTPSICLTIGASYDESWDYQTGDNSYSGGAYGHPFWGVGYVTRDCNSRELAKEIIEDCRSQVY